MDEGRRSWDVRPVSTIDWNDVELWSDPDTGATAVAYSWRNGSVRGIRVIDVPSGRLRTSLYVECADGSELVIEADHDHRVRRIEQIAAEEPEPVT
jgi:hypothetical protein